MLQTVDITTNDALGMHDMMRKRISTQQMEMQAKRASQQDISGKMEKLIFEVKSKIARLMVENKQTLWRYYLHCERDIERKWSKENGGGVRRVIPGFVTPAIWKEGMNSVLGMNSSVSSVYELSGGGGVQIDTSPTCCLS